MPDAFEDENEDIELPEWIIKPSDILLKSTALYGDSNTGKSTIIYHIFSVLKKYIPIFVVISPTAASNGDYDGRVPEVLIFKEPTKEVFKAIYQRQEASAAFYRKANNLNVLESLYVKIRDNRTDSILRTIKSKKISALERAKRQYANDPSKREEECRVINETNDETMRNVFRISIRKHRDYLNRKYQLNEQQRYCLKFLDFNPNICLVMDDCAAQIKQWSKDESIGKIYYQGRHNYITSIYTFQHDKLLETTFRQNVFNSIFTSEKSARAYFKRPTNNFDATEQIRIMKMIKTTFSKDEDKKYRKFAYLKERKQPYNMFTAAKLPKFKVCFPFVQNYCEIVKSGEDVVDDDNPFMKSFLI